ncbi:hypothetical protein [Bacillus sp. SN1]|uniref:hypothetical protein n=1 Tax=Bacillus sp. SN1 TaxID=2055158 RepID=UPI000C22810A|nr:hypothetical protein [Bacillus sp. SN1]PJH91885.1 hypothetical protein CVV77_19835 [Bacillus sp. SN1]PSI03492.1 hypothetical protein C7H81_20560 [Bacillus subtilis]
MSDPINNIGKIFTSLEKYYDTRARKIKVKARPVLVIGFEDDCPNPMSIDYEILPISTLKQRLPHPKHDIHIDSGLKNKLGLNEECYIRTHKTSWSNVKNMRIESPVGNLKNEEYELFKETVMLNREWVVDRTNYRLEEEAHQ